MMRMSFYSLTKKLKHLQNLVKRYDGRFVHNPIIIIDQANVVLTFEDINNANKFNLMHHITQQSYF